MSRLAENKENSSSEVTTTSKSNEVADDPLVKVGMDIHIGNPMPQITSKIGSLQSPLIEKDPFQLQADRHNPLEIKHSDNDPFRKQTQPIAAAPQKSNVNGLPTQLKNGAEAISGIRMDDTKVYYNSDKPAQLHAFAYAQGTNIHLAPGQEHHLPHETWHVVQQKQGKVQPTVTTPLGIAINDNENLEREADQMGNQIQNMPISLKETRHTNRCMTSRITQLAKKDEVNKKKILGSKDEGSATMILATADLLKQTQNALKTIKKNGNPLEEDQYTLSLIKQVDGEISVEKVSGKQSAAASTEVWFISHGVLKGRGFASHSSAKEDILFDREKLLAAIGELNPSKIFFFSCEQGKYLTEHAKLTNKGRTDGGVVGKAYGYTKVQNAIALPETLGSYFTSKSGTGFDTAREHNDDGEYDIYRSEAKLKRK